MSRSWKGWNASSVVVEVISSQTYPELEIRFPRLCYRFDSVPASRSDFIFDAASGSASVSDTAFDGSVCPASYSNPSAASSSDLFRSQLGYRFWLQTCVCHCLRFRSACSAAETT